jgi:hypothetical protein
MFFGGWSYPDAESVGVTDAEVAFEDVTFSENDEFDCAATGTDIAQATSAMAKIHWMAFLTDISSLHFNSKPTD